MRVEGYGRFFFLVCFVVGFEVYEVKVWDNVHQEQCEVLVNVFFFSFM